MKKITYYIVGVILLAGITLCAAAATDGVWTGKFEYQYDVILTLKTNGKVLTGTLLVADNNPVSENPGDVEVSPFIGAQLGENQILEGSVSGPDFKFSTEFNGVRIPYKGKIDGEKIKLTAVFRGQEISTTLTRSN